MIKGQPMKQVLHRWLRPAIHVRLSIPRLTVIAIASLIPIIVDAQSTRNILVLHVGSANQPAHILISKVFRDAFGADTHNQLFEEFLDYDRLNADDEMLAQTLGKKYAGKKMDLVLSDGAPVLNFLLRRGDDIWPRTPKVFSFVEPREAPAQLPSNFTGVTTTVDFAATLDLALQLMPNRRHVFYVTGISSREEGFRHLAEQEFSRFAGRIQLTFLDDLPLSELLVRLSELPDDSVVIFFTMLRDAGGHEYVPSKIFPIIASSSNAPVYCLFDSHIGSGAVGGVIIDIARGAEQAAKLGLRALDRGSASGLPVERLTNRPVVDWRQLQRWGISEKRIPSGTVIRFHTPSLLDQYKWYIVFGVAAILAQLALIMILVVEMRRRKKSDVAIKNLSGRLINASEEERKRIARELHDDIAQRLALVSIELDVMQPKVPMNDADDQRSLRQPVEQLNEVITDVHNLSHQLHSNKLQHLGLEVALKEVCQQIARQHQLEIQFTAENVPFPLQEDLALCFYRLAQEALNNSVKHSGSARVEVGLKAHDGTLMITVKDYGAGFDPTTTANGLGLATMRERLRLVEGKLLINSRPGGGTEVTAQARLERRLAKTAAA
jgi:signal transduction histidine kinase